MIYAFLNQKGGVGKTTLSLHVASALARSHQRVLLIDADPRQSAMKSSTVRSGTVDFAVIGMAKATLHKEIVSLSANYDHVVIDGPPRVTELARSIIIASDAVRGRVMQCSFGRRQNRARRVGHDWWRGIAGTGRARRTRTLLMLSFRIKISPCSGTWRPRTGTSGSRSCP